MATKSQTSTPITIGVSACLLGQPVRYDGQHRYNNLVNKLNNYFDLIGICPEVAIGLGVPRATIQLQQQSKQIKLVTVKHPELNHTEAMINFSQRCLVENQFSGLVLKDRSPSCGVGNTIIYNSQQEQHSIGHGLFTQTISDTLPTLPIISAGQLQQALATENFIKQVFLFAKHSNSL